MLGLGESRGETLEVIQDLFDAGCQVLTIGQYLAPSREHFPVAEFIRPEEFESIGAEARKLGFAFVASAPFVRSSYNAEEVFDVINHHHGESNV